MTDRMSQSARRGATHTLSSLCLVTSKELLVHVIWWSWLFFVQNTVLCIPIYLFCWGGGGERERERERERNVTGVIKMQREHRSPLSFPLMRERGRQLSRSKNWIHNSRHTELMFENTVNSKLNHVKLVNNLQAALCANSHNRQSAFVAYIFTHMHPQKRSA